MRKPKLEISIVMHADQAPELERSSSKFGATVEELIKRVFQQRLPLFDVSIRSIKADWPGAPGNFVGYERDDG